MINTVYVDLTTPILSLIATSCNSFATLKRNFCSGDFCEIVVLNVSENIFLEQVKERSFP